MCQILNKYSQIIYLISINLSNENSFFFVFNRLLTYFQSHTIFIEYSTLHPTLFPPPNDILISTKQSNHKLSTHDKHTSTHKPHTHTVWDYTQTFIRRICHATRIHPIDDGRDVCCLTPRIRIYIYIHFVFACAYVRITWI